MMGDTCKYCGQIIAKARQLGHGNIYLAFAEAGKVEGRREVVEWVKEDCDCGANLMSDRWHCRECRKKAFKEWGL